MKRLSGIAVFLFVMSAVHSQTADFRPEWNFGVNGGVTLSRVGFSPKILQTLLLQQSGGLTARYVSEKSCGIQLELNYALRGWTEQPNTNTKSYTRSLTYIELPALAHFYYSLGKRARVIVNLGPQIGYNIGEKELEKEIIKFPDKNYYNNYPVRNKFDWGLAGGMGFEVRTGIGSFVLEGRYYYGLSDIFGNRRVDIFQASHNQVIAVKLGYLVGW